MSRSLRVPVSLAAAILLGLSSAAPSLAETAPAAPPSADATAIAVPDGFELAPDGTTLVHVASGLRLVSCTMLGAMLTVSTRFGDLLGVAEQLLAPLARFADLDGPTWLAVDVEPALHFSTGVLHL